MEWGNDAFGKVVRDQALGEVVLVKASTGSSRRGAGGLDAG